MIRIFHNHYSLGDHTTLSVPKQKVH